MSARPKVLSGFIVIEGLDGAGTTTQLSRISARFRALGRSCYATAEPTDAPIGRLIRAALRKEIAVDPCTLALLFAADRNEHLFAKDQGIIARLARGEIVVCDRYLFSSLAYQSVGCGYDYVGSLNAPFPLPEHLIFIDVPPEECQRRIAKREGKELFEELEMQNEILRNYRRGIDSITGSGTRVATVDGTVTEAEVEEKVWSLVSGSPIGKG
ncbi:MAG TPA: dTMP kinase [Spirochaetia bacterium]|nr:dTMP kinase [Spirochaetia bacterium]